MGDAIDKRNLQDQIARSIIKRQFVNYITVEEAERRRRLKEEQEAQERAQKESAQKTQHQKDLETGYNRKTGSFSGQYGKNGDMNEVTKSQIQQILGEKRETLRHVIEENEHP